MSSETRTTVATPMLQTLLKVITLCRMGTPTGPHKITSVRQVALPASLMKAVDLAVGDYVHFRLSDTDDSVIEIIPSDVVDRRYARGRRQEQSARPDVGE